MAFKRAFLRALSLMLCVCLLAASFSGCKDNSSKTLYWLLSSSPKNLDPQTASGESELLIVNNCFAPLFEKDQNGQLVSSVLERYETTPDLLKYTFYLKDNIFWSIIEKREVKKYAPVTANDYVFAIQRLFESKNDADVMSVLRNIKNADKVLSGEKFKKLSVKVIDDKTFSITLKEKNSSFLEAFTSHELFPCNEQFFKSTSGRYGLSSEALIFNGSFVLSAWGESSIRLVSNKFSNNKPIASSVVLYQPKDTREHTQLISEGEIDAAKLSSTSYDALQNKAGFSVKKYTETQWVMLLNPQHEIWKNASLRSAVLSCTDRSIFKGGEHLTPSKYIISDFAIVFSQNYRELSGNIKTAEFNPQNAKSLYAKGLSELGITEIYNTEILVCENELCKENFSALNQIYQRELSLYFSPEYLSKQALLSRVKSGDFAAALVPLSVSSESPSSMLEYFYASSPNLIFNVNSLAFSQNLSSALTEPNTQNAVSFYKNAEQALYDTTIVNPLFSENGYFVSSKNTDGFYFNPTGSVIFNNVTKK